MSDEPVSYQGVPLGVPVLARDGEEFGILEHVLQIPDEDVFDGIVVWIGGGKMANKVIEHYLRMDDLSSAHQVEFVDLAGTLRFVDADQILAITTGSVRCDLDLAQVAQLPPPSGSPVNRIATLGQTGAALHNAVGRMFGRPHWSRSE